VIAHALPGLLRDWQPVDIPRDDARDAARDELSRTEYHQDDPGLLHRTLDWVFDRMGRLLTKAGDHTPGGLTGVVVLLALVVSAIVVLRLRLGPLRAARRRADPGLYGEAGPMSAARHRAAADAHAAAGRWEDAVQERLRAIVRALEERAVLDVRSGRTADEAAVEAGRELPAVAPRLRAAARTFDEVRYGGRTADAETDRELRELDASCARARPRIGAAEHVEPTEQAEQAERVSGG
jgi:uncharacterized protein DUF4129